MTSIVHILTLGGLVAGCALLVADDGPGKMSTEQLLSTPERITVDGRELALRTYMWRDFMPISPPDGKPLAAIFWVFSTDSTALPDGLTADAAWVVNGNDVWDTFFEDDRPAEEPPYQMERVARDGPKWGPHIEVDAIVRIRDSNGKSALLRASGQLIDRTD